MSMFKLAFDTPEYADYPPMFLIGGIYMQDRNAIRYDFVLEQEGFWLRQIRTVKSENNS